jgi:hypothetical protein
MTESENSRITAYEIPAAGQDGGEEGKDDDIHDIGVLDEERKDQQNDSHCGDGFALMGGKDSAEFHLDHLETKSNHAVHINCRDNPLWLPLLRADTGGRPYI